ncbi:MAG: hypothetical protein AB7D36_03970 [Oscillospiraceae bacterium]
MLSPNCGEQVKNGALFCSCCGTAQFETLTGSAAQATDLMGWSENDKHPEILKKAADQRRAAKIWCGILMLVFILGFGIAGALLDEMTILESLIIGTGLALLILIITLSRLSEMKKPIWEGSVTKKTAKKKRESDGDGENSRDYMELTVYLTGVNGGKRKLRTRNNRDWYDYLAIGDRVRYHPNFGTYEKYDKSGYDYLFCNVCGKRCSVDSEICPFCKSPLFKGRTP